MSFDKIYPGALENEVIKDEFRYTIGFKTQKWGFLGKND